MDLMSTLLAGGLALFGFTIPWSWIILAVVVVVGLLLVRTAMTLVKVAIIVVIGLVLFSLVEFVLHNFG
ncbi:MAG: hypothetical protein ACYDBQ_09845 [Thermoplasmatota archaeon]